MAGSRPGRPPLPSIIIPAYLFVFTVLAPLFTLVLQILVGYRHLHVRPMCRESLCEAFESPQPDGGGGLK